jgi:glycosyl hydrolase family 16
MRRITPLTAAGITAALLVGQPPVLRTAQAGTAAVSAQRSQSNATQATKWGTPVFYDDFSGRRLDNGKWWVYHSLDSANPRHHAATSLTNGKLRFVGGFRGWRDVSGGVAARYYQQYGRWEARFRVSRGEGYSAAILLWPMSDDGPAHGEIDLMEVNLPARQSGSQFIHAPGGAVHGHLVQRTDFTRWHTVAVEWRPHSLTYYLDGKKTWTFDRPWFYPRIPMTLTLQLDQGCGGWWVCRHSSSPAWVTMEVDWVRIYQLRSTRDPQLCTERGGGWPPSDCDKI